MLDSDFDALAQMGPAGGGEGGYDPRYGEELQRALGGMREFQAKLAVQNKQNEQMLPPGSMAVKTAKGTMDIKDLPIQTYEAMMRDREELNQIRGAFAQEASRLQQQEQQARKHPWVQLATALSANLAQAKDMPGWVQAAGRTAGQLNPTADQLRTQRLGVLGEEAQIAEKGAALSEAALRRQELLQAHQATLAQKKQADIDKAIDRVARLSPTKSGVAQQKDTVAAYLKAQGITDPDVVDAAYQAHVGMAEASKAGKEAEADLKVDVSKRIETLKTELGEERDVKKHGLKLQELGVQYGLKKDLAATQSEIRTAEMGQKELFKQEATLGKISPKDTDRLAAYDTTERYVDWFKEWVNSKQADGTIGPLANYTIGQLPQFMRPAERVKFESMITHETPRMLQMIGSGTPGGFSMMRFKGSIELLQKMGVSAPMRLDQMNEIFGVLYDVNSQQRKGVMDAYPRARWDLLSSLLGRDADYRPKGWKPFGGASAAAQTADPLEGRTATGPNGQKLIRRGGVWVPQ